MASEELKLVVSLVDKASDGLKRIENNLKSISTSTNLLGGSFKSVSSSLHSSLATLSTNIANAKARFEEFNKSVKDLRDALDWIGKKAMVVGSVLLGGFAYATKVSVEEADKLRGLSKITGLSPSEIYALSGALGEVKVNFEAIASALPRMNREIYRLASMKGGRISELFGLTGAEASQLDVSFAMLVARIRELEKQGKTSGEIFFEVVRWLKGIGNESVRSALSQLIFRNASLEVLKLLPENTAELQQLYLAYKAAAPSDTTITQVDKLGDSWYRMTTVLKASFMELVGSIAPELTALIQGLTQLFQAISNLPEPIKKALAGFMLFSGVLLIVGGIILHIANLIIGLIGLFPTLGSVISGIASVFSFLWEAIVGIVGAIAAVVGLPAWAVGLIIAAIVALVVVVIKYWDTIKDFLGKAWEWMKGIWGKFVDWLSDVLLKAWETLKGFFTKMWTKLKEFITNIIGWFRDAGRRIVEAIYNGIMSVINKPIEAIRNLVKKIRDYLPFSPAKEGALRDLDRVGEGFANTLVSSLRGVRGRILGEMAGLAGGIAASIGFPSPSLAYAPNVTSRRHISLNVNVTSDKYVDESVRNYFEREVPRVLSRLVFGR